VPKTRPASPESVLIQREPGFGTPHGSNGKDDDGDGKVDYPNDPGCTSSTDTDETDAAPSCHPSYPDFCIAPPPPDKNCDDFTQKNFRVLHNVPDPDPHRLDGDQDGRACEN